ncbi:probable dioxygenase [Geminocystis sp. NIES-3708]|uniref:VOC family protein n=1 Tax=Geminocystis sp. NIES-3708 TaxID=1615909 RepID=UPI0005FC9959|nr:VOC family protein [Geminocystis sp. NIES-3708]BAQ62607.1 probable dioxygenase [Geminocystis sp. NIES-3708]
MVNQVIFHLAIPINSINEAKNFYSDILGAKIGRENQHAVIFDFYGHQLVGHTTKEILIPPSSIYPRHFGLIFIHESDWNLLLTRCQDHLELYQPAKLRFKEQLTEHQTFFLQDPFYNILEFKFYRHYEAIFGANHIISIGDRED